MSSFLMLISIFLNWIVFSYHLALSTDYAKYKIAMPSYKNSIGAVLILWLITLIMPVCVLHLIFSFNWVALFFINISIIWFLGSSLLRFYRFWFASSRGPLRDMLEASIGSFIFLLTGFILRSYS